MTATEADPGRRRVVIVGGGPAGSATALALCRDPDLDVALIEASDYQTPRVGETLPPACQPTLEALGVWDEFVSEGHMPSHGTCSAWGRDDLDFNSFLFSPYGRGWHLDRRRFDAFLARQAAARGATVTTGARVASAVRSGAGWRLTVVTKDRRQALEAAWVVDATGRRAAFARRRGARPVLFDRLVGAFVFYQLDPDRSSVNTFTLVEAGPDGWWYCALLPGGQLAVAAMSDADLVKERGLNSQRQWRAHLGRSRHIMPRLEGAVALGPPALHAAHSCSLDRMRGDGWLAVGDAAMTFDPLSSQGIHQALESGLAAAGALRRQLAGETEALVAYEAAAEGEFEDYLRTRLEYYRQEHRWPDSLFWQRRHGAVTLDPMSVLCFEPTPAATGALKRCTMHLAVAELASLCDLCRTPDAAHRVVTAFKAGNGSGLSDWRAIQALQYLVEQGVLQSSRPVNLPPGSYELGNI